MVCLSNAQSLLLTRTGHDRFRRELHRAHAAQSEYTQGAFALQCELRKAASFGDLLTAIRSLDAARLAINQIVYLRTYPCIIGGLRMSHARWRIESGAQ